MIRLYPHTIVVVIVHYENMRMDILNAIMECAIKRIEWHFNSHNNPIRFIYSDIKWDNLIENPKQIKEWIELHPEIRVWTCLQSWEKDCHQMPGKISNLGDDYGGTTTIHFIFILFRQNSANVTIVDYICRYYSGCVNWGRLYDIYCSTTQKEKWEERRTTETTNNTNPPTTTTLRQF